jgi:prophage tail gpP-like protein
MCPPGSTIAFRVNGVVQWVGFVDGFDRVSPGATEITFSARDAMMQLVRAHIEHERTFNNITLENLALEAIKGAGIAEPQLFSDAAAWRSAVSGVPITDTQTVSKTFTSGPIVGAPLPPEVRLVSTGEAQGSPAAFDVETTQKTTVTRITGFKADKPIKWEPGETFLGALKKDTDRAGVFLRAGVDPDGNDPWIFEIGAPDGKQVPRGWLLNTRNENAPNNAVLVGPPQIRYVMTGRHSEYVVLGQGGGGKDGRKPIEGRFLDPEALSGMPLPAKRVVKDPQAKNAKQAQYRARKLCAEERRANRSFVYPILHRHTIPLLSDPTTRIIPVPDLVLQVDDDEHGIHGPMWTERVRLHRSAGSGTFSELTLIDPTDLVFGDDEITAPLAPHAKQKGWKKRR